MILSTAKLFLKSIGVFAAVLVVMITVQLVLGLIGLVVSGEIASAEQLFIERLYPVAVGILLVTWTQKKYGYLYSIILDATRFTSKNVVSFLKTIFFTWFVLYSVFAASGYFGHYEFIHYGIEKYSFWVLLKWTILVGFLANIVIAIGEEIIFRGFLLNYISKLTGSKWFALLFTSFAFCLHPYSDFLNFVIAFLTALVMGYAYFKFRTLYIPMGIHFAYNVFNFSLASTSSRGPQMPYLIKFEYEMIQDGFGGWIDLSIILGIVLIFLALWMKKTSDKRPVVEPLVKKAY